MPLFSYIILSKPSPQPYHAAHLTSPLRRSPSETRGRGPTKRKREKHIPIAATMVIRRSLPSSKAASICLPMSESGTLTSSLALPSPSIKLKNSYTLVLHLIKSIPFPVLIPASRPAQLRKCPNILRTVGSRALRASTLDAHRKSLRPAAHQHDRKTPRAWRKQLTPSMFNNWYSLRVTLGTSMLWVEGEMSSSFLPVKIC